jgi:hypothetical protein
MPPFFVEDMTESQKAEYFAFLKTVNESKGGHDMECTHGAILDVEGGKKCLLCGAFIPDNQEAPATDQKQAGKAADGAGTNKSTSRKKTAKNAK